MAKKTKPQSPETQSSLPARINPVESATQLRTVDGVVRPPSVRAMLGGAMAAIDEIAGAFEEQSGQGGEIAQFDPNTRSFPMITIEHDQRCFMIGEIPVETVEGFVIGCFQSRKYWEKAYSPKTKEAPVCASIDLKAPVPSASKPQHTDCVGCQHAKFGSAKVGEGQACKTVTYLFIVNPEISESGISVLVLPPTAIQRWYGTMFKRGYWETAKLTPGPSGNPIKYTQMVWTRISLQPVEDAAHCEIVPEAITTVQTPDEARAIAEIREKMGPNMVMFRDLQAMTSDNQK